MDCAQLANTAASALVALCCIVFAVVYHVHAPWRSTSVGRHLMLFTLAIGGLSAYTVLITVWPDGVTATVLRWGRTVLSVVIAGLVVQRTRMVLTAQHKAALVSIRADRQNPPH
jgi:hypothetical protein